jgi:hypothetical protein
MSVESIVLDEQAQSQQDVATLRVAYPIVETYAAKREAEIMAGLMRLYHDGVLTTSDSQLYAAVAGIAELRSLVRMVARQIATHTHTLAEREG